MINDVRGGQSSCARMTEQQFKGGLGCDGCCCCCCLHFDIRFCMKDSEQPNLVIQSNFAYSATHTTVIIYFLYLSQSAPFFGDDYQNKLLKLCQNFSLLSQFNLITVRNIVYIVYILISTLTTKGSPPADCSQLCHSKIPRDIYSYSVINL